MLTIDSKKLLINLAYIICSLLFINCKDSHTEKIKLTTVEAKGDISLKEKRIGYSSPSLNAPFYQALLASIQSNSQKNNIRLLFSDAEDIPQKQVNDVVEMLSKGIDVLLLNPKDPLVLLAATKKANKAGVPIFIVDGSIDPSADYITTIQSNNVINGQLTGKWLADNFKDKPLNIALLSGKKGNPVGRKRRQGVLQGITETQLKNTGKTNLSIVTQQFTNWSYKGGLIAMEKILSNHSNINVIVAESDVCVLGAIKALEDAKKTDDILIVAAADGQKEAIKHIIDDNFYGCTAMNSPVHIGKISINYAIDYLNGRRDFPNPSFTPPLLITKENAWDYYDAKALF